MSGQMLRRHVMLALPGRTVHHRNILLFRPGPQATAESSGHAHQVVIVQRLVRTVKSAPPYTQSSAGLAHSEVRVQNHPINAVVTAFEKIAVETTQLVRHDLRSVTLFPKSPQPPPMLPPRGLFFGAQSPKKRSCFLAQNSISRAGIESGGGEVAQTAGCQHGVFWRGIVRR